MNLLISFAFSELIPEVITTICRLLPPAESSTVKYSKAFSETFRLTSFSSKTVLSAFSRSSEEDSMVIRSSDRVTELSVHLKSYRCPTSLEVWSMAFLISCGSTVDVISNEGIIVLS